jgi:hypothetical protein
LQSRTLMITSGITAPHMLCDLSSCQVAHFAVHVQHLLLSVTPCPTVPCSAIVVGVVGKVCKRKRGWRGWSRIK